MTIPDGQMDVIFYHGGYPLWLYLKDVLGINIVDVCARITKEQPVLKTSDAELIMNVVDLPHSNELDHTSNNDVIFLVNSVNQVFQSLQAGVERDGEKMLEAFKFKLDANHNLFLVGAKSDVPISDKALAVVKRA